MIPLARAVRFDHLFLAILLMTALALVAKPATAEPSAADQAAIKSTISAQLDAFQRDDAAGAYSFASPAIKSKFPSPDVFMGMVQSGYRPVYRPRSFDFIELKDIDGRLIQYVDIVGPENGLWRAAYTMERQPDGSWLIAGVYLAERPGVGA